MRHAAAAVGRAAGMRGGGTTSPSGRRKATAGGGQRECAPLTPPGYGRACNPHMSKPKHVHQGRERPWTLARARVVPSGTSKREDA